MIGGILLWNQWWAWICFGLVLGALEMLIPVYLFLGFSGGAVLTGLLKWVGVFDQNLPWTLVLFAVLSAVCALGLRLGLGAPTRAPKIWKSDIND